MDSFSRNNYVIVGSRTLHCEPPQVYQPTPEQGPPGRPVPPRPALTPPSRFHLPIVAESKVAHLRLC